MKEKIKIILQAFFALIQNSYLDGFLKGKLYNGSFKKICTPGLNCYSCPGAISSCPIGALSNGLSSINFKLPFYVIGFIMLFGALMGRLICGIICPFGFLQDLLIKIPFIKKIKTFKGDKYLRLLKYIVLITFVIILPIIIKLTPGFCKYICPSGTLSGLILLSNNLYLFELLGKIFTIKFSIFLVIIILSLVIHRPFCKYICPLGALYAPFNKSSILQLTYNKKKCTHCGKCCEKCPMNVDPTINQNSMECIRCTKCIEVCNEGCLKLGIHKK